MAVALHRIRFFYKLRPFNLTESLIRYGKVIRMKGETFCLFFILWRINLMKFSFPHMQSKLCSLPTQKSCSVWAGRIFPSGSDREGRIGPRIRQHRYLSVFKILPEQLLLPPTLPTLLEIICRTAAGVHVFCRTHKCNVVCRMQNAK